MCIQCLTIYLLFDLMILYHSHTQILEMLSHLKMSLLFIHSKFDFFLHFPLKLKFMQGKKQKTYTCRLLVTELIGIYTLTPYSIRNDWSHVKADDQDLSHTALSKTHEKGITLYLELTF